MGALICRTSDDRHLPLPRERGNPLMEAKRGMRFIHARMLDEDSQPMVMRVTAIRQGAVYYRGDDSKGSWYIAKERFPDIVKEVIT